jgi:hypothetical protein
MRLSHFASADFELFEDQKSNATGHQPHDILNDALRQKLLSAKRPTWASALEQ